MDKSKGWITLLGFFIAGTGFIALVLSLVSIKFAFLTWIDAPGPLFGFVFRIAMIVVGIIMIYLTQTDFSGETPDEF